MTTLIPNIEALKGDSIDIEMNFKRIDITGYLIRSTIWDSNKQAYQLLGLSINPTTATTSLAQDYNFKVNDVEYTITTSPSMTYSEIVNLMREELKPLYDCQFVGFGNQQDIQIKHNTIGSEYKVSVTAGVSNNLLTLLNVSSIKTQLGLPQVIYKASEGVVGGDSSQVNWIDTRAGYQDFGLSVNASTATSSLAQVYDITVNDETYEITLTLNETYDSIVSKLNTAIGDDYTCSVIGLTPNQDIRIIHNTLGDDCDVEISAGEDADLLTLLNAPLDDAVTGYTNKGWYNIYVSNNETKYFIGDCYIEIEVEDLNGKKISQRGRLILNDSSTYWSTIS